MNSKRQNEKKTRSPKWVWWLILSIVVIGLVGYGVNALERTQGPKVYSAEIVNEFPHDEKSYCQGLAFGKGTLYEGTGQYGQSVLKEVDLKTGRPLRQVRLDERLFGEGITVWDDLIYQVTWKRHVGYIYDRETLQLKDQFRISGQGWGLTHDDQHLILSDGTPHLRFIDAKRFNIVRRLAVKDRGRLVSDLNELEYINGEIWANVWFKDYIIRISPKDGQVLGTVDLSNLFPRHLRSSQDSVLNGIAYEEEQKRLFVTGKNWPKLFEIKLTNGR